MIKKFKVNSKQVDWQEPQISYVEAVAAAGMDTNDNSLIVSIKVLGGEDKELNHKANIAPGDVFELEEWFESEKEFIISIRVRKNGTVS